jgi:dTDP-4-amino-4,6-dideoxygalactose transaminase
MNNIPMLNLKRQYDYMKKDIDAAIEKCLEHQRWIFGPEIKELEDTIAQYIGVRHSVGVSSGTDALVLSLRALAIKLKGEEYFDKKVEIITTPFTFTATGDAILRAGAIPVFIDIDLDTFNISIEKIKEYLANTSNNATGIIPVHLYGQSCEMDEILAIADEIKLFIVEDVAQAFGGTWKDKKLGSLGTVGAFSFFPSKNLGGFGDGGMVCTNDDEIANLVRMLLRHGGKDKYNVDHIGYNARLDTLHAATLLVKLKYIDEFTERKRQIARIYSEQLLEIEELVLPTKKFNSQNGHAYHQYTILTSKRDELQAFLKEKGISTMIYYPFPLHKMKVFTGRMKISNQLKNAERASEQVLSLPLEPLQTSEETLYVTKSIKQFFKM